jgi:thiamine biosynthesis lipoprotein
MPVAVACEAMRTRFEIVLADEDREPASLRAAGEEALEEIARVEAALSPFRRDSVFSRLHAERTARVDGALFSLLERAGRLTEALEGAFDLTIGALTERLRRGEPVAGASVGFARNIRLDAEASTVTLAPGARLDPGAIGKGYALERAADLLRAAGVRRALLHGGTSSVAALGRWSVAVQHPRRPERMARVELSDSALGVSAVAGRLFEKDGVPVGHIIDPRSGQPVEGALLAAVVCRSPTDADAISTALLVLGEAGMTRVVGRFPEASLLLAIPHGAGLRLATAGTAFCDTGLPFAP